MYESERVRRTLPFSTGEAIASSHSTALKRNVGVSESEFLIFLFCTKSLAFKFSCLLRISAVLTYFSIYFLTFGLHRIFGIAFFVLGFRFLIRSNTLSGTMALNV